MHKFSQVERSWSDQLRRDVQRLNVSAVQDSKLWSIGIVQYLICDAGFWVEAVQIFWCVEERKIWKFCDGFLKISNWNFSRYSGFQS